MVATSAFAGVFGDYATPASSAPRPAGLTRAMMLFILDLQAIHFITFQPGTDHYVELF
ncbi:MAG: hypothetical protein Q8L13_26955 [Bradyrhizobium sp.]|uniref:hypothetical protein n=1 Tax=Bradyrhizobium sp. TaxID=376 RepID=UPI0027304864|nr:hypothetical protein [Bradyrhizobium sp.]MDP1869968.1 hypothetical protein [Bradyrhizobium sp.]